jgi:chromosome segregation ATPase
MDDLVQANLELHEELGKEVRINLENEAKISRLEKQQVRYEEEIQYLYGIIEKFEIGADCNKKEKDSLTLRISELQSQLRDSEKVCEKKEKFILFRESQLSELEKIIYQLKQSASSSYSEMSRTRTDLAPLETMTNTQRLEEIQANVERLYLFSVRSERLPDVGTAERLRERTNRAIVLIHNTLVSQIDQTNNNLTECQNEVKRLNTALNNCIEEGQILKTTLADQSAESKSLIHRLEESLEGAQAEIDGKDAEIFRLGNICDEQDLRLRDGIDQVEERDRHIGELNAQLEVLIGVSERVETNSDHLLRESEQVRRNLEMAERAIGERDTLINQYRNRLNNLQDERDIIADRLDVAWARFMTERLETRSLRRQRLALRIANRQLQIRLMNPGPIIAPPPPQPVEQIWLLL